MSNFAADSKAATERNFRTEILASTGNKPSISRAGTRCQKAVRVRIYARENEKERDTRKKMKEAEMEIE